MTLKEELREAAINHLRHVYDNPILMTPISMRENAKSLKPLYDQGVIDDKIIEESLEYAVLKRAKSDFEFLIANDGQRKYADVDVPRPEMFAYAIEKQIFTDAQLQEIPFDAGENPKTYCQEFGKPNLLSILREEILNLEK